MIVPDGRRPYCCSVHGLLSFPALLVLAWGIAGLLWWDKQRGVITLQHMPWLQLAMVLVVSAMAVALAWVPAPWQEQLIRGALVVEGIAGFAILRRRQRERSGRG